jgi:hypothetical protein
MIADAAPGRRITAMLAGFLAVAALALAVSGAHDSAADTSHGHGAMSPAKITKKQAAFHDAMRKLWEDHITWTRLAIVSFAHDLPDLPATEARLLDNQTDIGNAVKPYYGKAAGNQLTALLDEHILVAVELLQAAKAGDTAKVTDESARWYANGNEIADFLAAANPRFWPKKAMRAGMRAHLDQTLAEAQHELGGDYAASVADYEVVHAHMLAMADTLSNGIMRSFPRRFR